MFAPDNLRKHGLRAAHPRPLVSHGKQNGKAFASFRTTPDKAWHFPSLEYANAGSSVAAIVLDCDNPDAFASGLPSECPPNWRVIRESNGHFHAAWTLRDPVHRYPQARQEPLSLLKDCTEFLAASVKADPGFNGVLCHNPAPRFKMDGFKVAWGRQEPYRLQEIADVIPFGWQRPVLAQTGVGRNCDLFQSLMRWAGQERNINIDAFTAALTINQEFQHPLPLSEVQATAKSVEKYRKGWVAKGWHKPAWLKKQKRLGKKGGLASARVRQFMADERKVHAVRMRREGMTLQKIADNLGITKGRVSQILKAHGNV